MKEDETSQGMFVKKKVNDDIFGHPCHDSEWCITSTTRESMQRLARMHYEAIVPTTPDRTVGRINRTEENKIQ